MLSSSLPTQNLGVVLVVPPDLVLQMVGRYQMGQQNRHGFDGLVDMDYEKMEVLLGWGGGGYCCIFCW